MAKRGKKGKQAPVPVDAADNWLQRVRLTAAQPGVWLICARRLRQAAEDLWIAGNEHDRSPGSLPGTEVIYSFTNPDFTPPETGGDTRDVCFMLFGYALENLTKGIIFSREPKLVKSESLKVPGGHKLAYLFERAQISLTDKERAVVERTTRLTLWKGRYPVPLQFGETSPHDPMLGYIAVGDSWPPDEYAALSTLYERAKTELIKTMQDIPPLPADYNFDT